MSTFDLVVAAIAVAFIGYEIYRHRSTPTVAKALSGFQKLAAKLEAAVTHHSTQAEQAQLSADTHAADAAQASKALAAVKTITGA